MSTTDPAQTLPEPAAFDWEQVPPPYPQTKGDGMRYDRFGNRIRSRAKPHPVPEPRKGHDVTPRYSTRVGKRGVQATCSCGWEGTWFDHFGAYGIERAGLNGDDHRRWPNGH